MSFTKKQLELIKKFSKDPHGCESKICSGCVLNSKYKRDDAVWRECAFYWEIKRLKKERELDHTISLTEPIVHQICKRVYKLEVLKELIKD